MEIVVWPAKWGAASLDPPSLSALAYIRFSGAPVQVRAVAGPLVDGFPPQCPRLRHGNHEVTDIEQIFQHLRKENYGVEYGMDDADIVRMTARIRAVQLRLWPAVQHHWWLESGVYSRLTRPAYASALAFPLSVAYPVYRHVHTRRRLLNGFGYDLDRIAESRLLEQVVRDGEDCLAGLSVALGDSPYFIGDSPCSLDALVFGYLYPVLRAPGPSKLLSRLQECQNLVEFCRRVQRRYFPELADVQCGETGDCADDDSKLVGVRNAALFVGLTGFVFGAFALHSGWLTV